MKKILAILGILGIGTVVFGSSNPMEWSYSYETVGFDTPTQDLGVNQYAVSDVGEWYVKENASEQFYTTRDASKIVGKNEVAVLCERCVYYDVFENSKGQAVRFKSDSVAYHALGQRNAGKPQRNEILGLLNPPTAYAVGAFNDNSTSTASAVTSLTWSHTTSGSSETLLVVTASYFDFTAGDRGSSGVTFNGTAMTEVSAVAGDSSPAAGEMWYLNNPDEGSYNVVITAQSGTTQIQGIAASFTGITNQAPEANSNTQFSSTQLATTTITAVTTDAMIVSHAWANAADCAATFPQTLHTGDTYVDYAIENTGSAMTYQIGTGATVVGWTELCGETTSGYTGALAFESYVAAETTVTAQTTLSGDISIGGDVIIQ